MIQVALLLVAVLSLILGTFVLLNNPRSSLFRLYFAFSIFSSLWMAVNALVVNTPIVIHNSGTILAISKLITPLSLLTAMNLLFFLKIYRKFKTNISDIALFVTIGVIFVFSSSHYNVYLNSKNQLTLGALYPYYLVILLITVSLIFYTLYKKPKTSDLKSRQHRQTQYLRRGTLAAVIPAILLGSILPIFSNSSLTNLGPLFSIFFLIYAASAIVKYRLFDVRILVARSLAYLLSLGLLASVFTLATYFVSNLVLPNASSGVLRAVYTVFAVLLAFIFPSTKRFFDKYTNKIFYRDSYDTQALLDDFNKMLVTTYGLKNLAKRSSEFLMNNLKSNFCIFNFYNLANDSTNSAQHFVHGTDDFITKELLTSLENGFSIANKKVIIADDLDDKFSQYRSLMIDNGISIIARLGSSRNDKGIGYLLIGQKKSGSIYSLKDAQTIEIITNELVIALQNALRFEEISQFNITLQDKVDQATAKLRKANDKLRALDETKDDFISMASHQLRTPLTSVKGYLSMVIDGDVGKVSKSQKDMLNQAFFSSQRMVYLIADLLNVSRLKTGKFIIEPSPVNLAEIITQELSQLVETATSKDLKLSYDKPKSFPALMLDETKTRQVIMNFVDNAIYYTPNGGAINVRLLDNPGAVELRVEDNGIGVPKAEQHHLFGKFYRAGNARKARPDGTGLGLFMAKKVVLAEGGSIIFDSTEGKGSTFGFTFPKGKLTPKDGGKMPVKEEPAKDKELAPV